MVYTRSQRRKLLAKMAGESHMETGEPSHNATNAFRERILERMEELESYWITKMNLVIKDQEDTSKMREELDKLRTQNSKLILSVHNLKIKSRRLKSERSRFSRNLELAEIS